MTDVASQAPVEGDERPVLTNRQGHEVYDNQNQRTVGARGPATLENYHFIEKITHFDRERIPERVVHARGAGAHGFSIDEAEVTYWGLCPACSPQSAPDQLATHHDTITSRKEAHA